MKQQMVVTNLRLPAEDLLTIKSAAGEAGMSVNEYITVFMRQTLKAHMLGYPMAKIKETMKRRKRDPIWEWPNLHKKIKFKPMGSSEDDKLIYGE